jgi:hypothetical protein
MLDNVSSFDRITAVTCVCKLLYAVLTNTLSCHSSHTSIQNGCSLTLYSPYNFRYYLGTRGRKSGTSSCWQSSLVCACYWNFNLSISQQVSASFHLQRSNKGPLESSREGAHNRTIRILTPNPSKNFIPWYGVRILSIIIWSFTLDINRSEAKLDFRILNTKMRMAN